MAFIEKAPAPAASRTPASRQLGSVVRPSSRAPPRPRSRGPPPSPATLFP